jgi:hypothetical protein
MEFVAYFVEEDGTVPVSNMENLFGTPGCLWLLPLLERVEYSDIDPNESDLGTSRADSAAATLWLLA